jgi:hypothetical protein
MSTPHWRETAEDPAAPTSHRSTEEPSSADRRFHAWLRRNAAMVFAVVVLITVVASSQLA